jgi:epoxyqueuosine reductase QueG
VASGITKRFCRHISQDVCPWNVRFARELPGDSPFAPREAIAGKDARTLARALLAMSQEQFSAAFKARRLAAVRSIRRVASSPSAWCCS